MALLRKMMSVYTVGLIRWQSNAERRAAALELQAKAAKHAAKANAARAAAEARLLDAQTRAMLQQADATPPAAPPTA